MPPAVAAWRGPALAAYGFGAGHPFGPDRHDAFWSRMDALGLTARVEVRAPRRARREQLALFHDPAYLDFVAAAARRGSGWLDGGDTPVVQGIEVAAATVVGSVLDAVDWILAEPGRRGFVPIAGLHHARRDAAAGFCVYNDCGVAIEWLRRQHGVRRIAYVDIDAHHGDGVHYAYEADPELILADLHEDGRYLYPGTGAPNETGRGAAAGTKLNIPLPPGADDAAFLAAWARAEAHLEAGRPGFILFQCGADSLAGDPITHLRYSEAAHRHAARRLAALADRHCGGRLLALGGGGYNRRNLARAWCAVVEALLGDE